MVLLWQPEEQSHLKEGQLAQGTKELNCSKPKQPQTALNDTLSFALLHHLWVWFPS